MKNGSKKNETDSKLDQAGAEVTRSFATKPVRHIITSDVSPHSYIIGINPNFLEVL